MVRYSRYRGLFGYILIIWYNPNKKCYYHRFYDWNPILKYKIGDKNSYDHEVVYILENIYLHRQEKRLSRIKHKVLTKFISFLQNINER